MNTSILLKNKGGVYVYTHLGLGDHIICNGIVRYVAEQCKSVYVFCKKHTFNNVEYMYRDNCNIHVVPVGEDAEVVKFINKFNLHDKTIRIGFEYLTIYPSERFDFSFYKALNLPFEYRFEKFFFTRDIKKEQKIAAELNPTQEDYIFIHGDLDRSKIRNDLKIIENPEQYKIFDLLTLLENAKEIHLMESSLKCLINSFKMLKPKLYYHQYARQYPEYYNTQGLNSYIDIL